MQSNHIYQFSLIDALMDGVCEEGIPASKLRSFGNQGLGTFSRIDGELVFLDGKIFQLQSGGRAREVDYIRDCIPFAVSTHFFPQHIQRTTLRSKADLDAVFGKLLSNAKNLFISYRMAGIFARVKCRTICGQEFRGQPLAELGGKQSVEEYENAEGDVVGFRTPKNWQGFGVAGHHLHFIKRDRSAGGHVLEICAFNEIELQMAVSNNIHIELPATEEFNAARLVTDSEKVKAVEG